MTTMQVTQSATWDESEILTIASARGAIAAAAAELVDDLIERYVHALAHQFLLGVDPALARFTPIVTDLHNFLDELREQLRGTD